MISEDDLDNFDPSNPANPAGVAIVNKHASIAVVVKDTHSYHDLKTKELTDAAFFKPQASPSKVIGEASGSAVISPPKNLDKINNLVQKETALGRAGVTREKAYRVIATALDAHKWMDVVDKQGNVKQEWVADVDKQRWGAEMAGKLFGDFIERKEIEMDVGDKTLDRLRALSVAELKARAADLLLGKRGAVDAEVSRA